MPDRFDINRDSVILEGRSDYYILRYGARLLQEDEIFFLPGLGAGTLSALVALCAGWNLKYLFVLDSDRAGRRERDRYVREFALPSNSITTLSHYLPDISVIEDILGDEARSLISSRMNLEGRPTKPQIKRYFQESLATGSIFSLGEDYEQKVKALINSMKSKLAGLEV